MNSEADRKIIKLLSTRSLSEETRTRAALSTISFDENDLIRIRLLIDETIAKCIAGFDVPGIFTSVHAVESVIKNLSLYQSHHHIKKAFSLSGRTSVAVAAARAELIDTASSASALAKKIAGRNEYKELMYFCGNKRLDELPQLLRNLNVLLHEITVYETRLSPKQFDLTAYDGILFFSPSAVESFFSCNKLTENITCFCIGNTTANAIRSFDQKAKMITSDEPSENGLLNTINTYYQVK